MTSPKLTFGCSLGVEGYWDVAEFARRAESLGFDRITMGEHLMDGIHRGQRSLTFRLWPPPPGPPGPSGS